MNKVMENVKKYEKTSTGYSITEVEQEIEYYKLEELSEDKQKYILRHMNRAEEILRKTAFTYKRRNFININRLNVIIDTHPDRCGGYLDSKNELYISSKYLENMFKRKYNKRFLETLMHEFIHCYVAKQLDFNKYDNYKDCTFTFCSIVLWFSNKTDYSISLNGTLSRDFKTWQPELHKLIKEGCNFYQLESKLIDGQIQMRDKIEDWNKTILKEDAEQLGIDRQVGKTEFTNRFNWIYYNTENESITSNETNYVRQLMNFNGKDLTLLVETNKIALGLDFNPFLDSNDDWGCDSILNWNLCEECDTRYYLNEPEDAELKDLRNIA